MDAIEDASGSIQETISQVGVSFATTIDGWPIIGPGGKIYVHMAPNGELLGYELYRRLPRCMGITVPISDIMSSKEALALVFKREGLESNDYNLVRAEFGYYYDAKHSVREILAPAYAFYLQSKKPNSPTILAFSQSALKGEYAKIIETDQARENTRKSKQIEGIIEADNK